MAAYWVDGEIIDYRGAGSERHRRSFEALTSYSGAYAMVCREFAKQIIHDHPDVVYINREDDMGLENLRKAKLGYYPEYLLKKYTAKEK